MKLLQPKVGKVRPGAEDVLVHRDLQLLLGAAHPVLARRADCRKPACPSTTVSSVPRRTACEQSRGVETAVADSTPRPLAQQTSPLRFAPWRRAPPPARVPAPRWRLPRRVRWHAPILRNPGWS